MFTVYSDYFATGEGRTLSILYTINAETSEDALDEFKQSIPHGDWYGLGAEVVNGFNFDNHVAKLLVTDAVREILENPSCYCNYSSSLHFNFS
jgi:hypothetical protein